MLENKKEYVAKAKFDDYIELVILKNTLGVIKWEPVPNTQFEQFTGYLKDAFINPELVIARVVNKPQFKIVVLDKDTLHLTGGTSGTFTEEDSFIHIEVYNCATANFYEQF